VVRLRGAPQRHAGTGADPMRRGSLAGTRPRSANRAISPSVPGSATSARSWTPCSAATALPRRDRGADDRRFVASLRPDVTRRGRGTPSGRFHDDDLLRFFAVYQTGGMLG